MKKPDYDFIIAGSGCAGLSLAVRLIQSGCKFERVLIIDKDLKNTNDRTWCFWTEQKNNWFDSLIFKRWQTLVFRSALFEKKMAISPYNYCMVRGIDFYNYCLTIIKNDKRFDWLTDNIENVYTESAFAYLKTANKLYSANYLFNSAFRTPLIKKNHSNLTQHFKGYVIETQQPVFDESLATFMDFSVQQHNDCRFVYVLPISKHKALIEYTGFSDEGLKDEVYDVSLKEYIEQRIGISHYTITETEKGEIPMLESTFVNTHSNRIINIGIAGNAAKASSGYAFYFIQKQIEFLIAQLKTDTKILKPYSKPKRFNYYDKVFLSVLKAKYLEPRLVFETLFKRNKVENVLAFLNEESSFTQEFGIINSLPKKEFMRAGWEKLLNISKTS